MAKKTGTQEVVKSILAGTAKLLDRDIHETFREQLDEIDELIWCLVDETN